MATLATGAHPDVHEIPHLVWYHRGEGRLVEYGSSFGAMRAAGTRRAIRDAIVEMNAHHLSRRATTVFESLEDAGLTAAAVNTPCYRGRTRHIPTVPGLVRPVDGPRRFFYFSLFESDVTGAPLAIRTRTGGSIDAYAAAVGRWLVTRDGFDFLFYYLPDYDYASHALGPGGAQEALRRSDQAVGALVEAAGGLDEFLQRYVVVLCSDHGQTHVGRVARLQNWVGDEGLVTASNRAGMVYTDEPRKIAERLAREDAVDVALFTEDGAAIALRDGGELRLGADVGGWQNRARHALANPNAGDVLISAAEGVEFADLGGRHHAGGGARLAAGRRLTRPSLSSAPKGRRPRGSPASRRSFSSSGSRAGLCPRSLSTPRRMVDEQLRGRDIAASGLEAMERVPREAFVPVDLRRRAYDDAALPIGSGQTISQPYMVARILEELGLDGDEHALDVGTGSGYQAAVLAQLAREVHSIERIPELAEQARRNFESAGIDNVQVHVGDGSRGLPEHAPTTRSRSRRLRRESRTRSTTSSRSEAASSSRFGERHGQRLEVIVRRLRPA